MIQNLQITNFKSLKAVDLKLSNLNLLTGLNGSGKSSVIQTLLLLRQSKELCSQLQLTLNGTLADVGNFQEIFFRSKEAKTFSFLLRFENKTALSIETITPDRNYIYSNPNLNKITFTNNFRSDAHYVVSLKSPNSAPQEIYLVENQLKEQALFNRNFQYLQTERKFRKDGSYTPNVSEVISNKMLGNEGEHTAFFLFTYGTDKKVASNLLHHPKAKSDYLIDQVNAWLSEISTNVHLKLALVEERVELTFGYENNYYKPNQVGFGLSYILPVIVALLTAEKDKLIIIENPELHIHPRGQAELGRLLAAAAQTGAQVIVETHSDHVLNGVRVAVKEKPVIKDIVTIFFHEKISEEKEEYSKITPIKIDKQGELSEYPQNFLDEWSNQLLKLI